MQADAEGDQTLSPSDHNHVVHKLLLCLPHMKTQGGLGQGPPHFYCSLDLSPEFTQEYSTGSLCNRETSNMSRHQCIEGVKVFESFLKCNHRKWKWTFHFQHWRCLSLASLTSKRPVKWDILSFPLICYV